MKSIVAYIWVVALLFSSCRTEDAESVVVPEGKRAVQFTLAGVMGKPLVEASSSGNTRMGNAPADSVDKSTLVPYKPQNLPDGTTLWIQAEEISKGSVSDGEGEKEKVIQSYVVRNIGEDGKNQMLYPCEVDSMGNVVKETSVPMFLNIGSTYYFRAVSPARAFVEGTDHALYVNNKEYVIATDERYSQTASKEVEITAGEDDSPIQIVEMNPLINQTAQLEFTIHSENEPNIHSLDVLPQGIEISGLQVQYDNNVKKEDAIPWNWSWGDTLRAYVGDNREKIQIRRDDKYVDSFIEKKENGVLYIHVPVLPTNAFSSSIIVLFNIEVNGSPTQYEMMLNQKVFRAAYTYHYKGEIKLEDGVTVITWQYVNWEQDVPIIPRPQENKN